MAKSSPNTDIAVVSPLDATSVEKMILVIRDKQVLLDRDLATLYGVETRRINEQVKRNIERSPEDFCFQLDKDEFENLKSQNVISSWGGDRFRPYVFTEQGFAVEPNEKWNIGGIVPTINPPINEIQKSLIKLLQEKKTYSYDELATLMKKRRVGARKNGY